MGSVCRARRRLLQGPFLEASWVVIRVPLRAPLKGSIGILHGYRVWGLLGGSCVVFCGVISPPIGIISIVTLLIAPLLTTHEP